MKTYLRSNSYLVALLVFVASSSLLGCGAGPAIVPTAFDEYNAKDGTFACECPEEWSVEGGGKHGPLWATFASGPAEIRINADVVGSLLGDIAGNALPNNGEESPMELDAVHKVHEMGQADAEAKYNGYEEIGTPKKLVVSLGPARKSEFKAAAAFGDGLHGYRVTVLGKDKRVVVYAVCPEEDWTELQPAFDQVINTLKRGRSE